VIRSTVLVLAGVLVIAQVTAGAALERLRILDTLGITDGAS
jgi:hypothetical protein